MHHWRNLKSRCQWLCLTFDSVNKYRKTVLVQTVMNTFTESISCFLFQEEKDDELDDPQDGGEPLTG